MRNPTYKQGLLWKKRMAQSGTFLCILVFNSALILILGGMVVYHIAFSPSAEPMVFVKVKAPPPPPKPPSRGGSAVKSLADPSVTITPPSVEAPHMVVSTISTSFQVVNSNASVMPSIAVPNFTPTGTGLADGTTGGGISHKNPFGDSPDSGVPGFIGELYDLKQTPDGASTPMSIKPPEGDVIYKDWAGLAATHADVQTLREYVKVWNQDILDCYYKSPVELSSTQLFIPIRHSEEATKAFNVADKVVAKRWVIHYHGNIVPPKTGRYRFIGFGDDFLVVRVGDHNVLDGSCGDPLDPSANSKEDVGKALENQLLHCGRWFDTDESVPLPIDILIGEGPGGSSGFVLLIQEEGDNSAKGDYPVFQVSQSSIKDKGDMPSTFTGKTLLFGAQ